MPLNINTWSAILELEKKLKELSVKDSFLDVVLECRKLEPEYKKSDFYKATKMSLSDLLRQYKMWSFANFDNLGDRIQELIDSLNFDNVSKIIEQFGNTFSTENDEIRKAAETYKKLLEKQQR